MAMRRTSLSDSLPMDEWQSSRDRQVRGEVSGPIGANPPTGDHGDLVARPGEPAVRMVRLAAAPAPRSERQWEVEAAQSAVPQSRQPAPPRSVEAWAKGRVGKGSTAGSPTTRPKREVRSTTCFLGSSGAWAIRNAISSSGTHLPPEGGSLAEWKEAAYRWPGTGAIRAQRFGDIRLWTGRPSQATSSRTGTMSASIRRCPAAGQGPFQRPRPTAATRDGTVMSSTTIGASARDRPSPSGDPPHPQGAEAVGLCFPFVPGLWGRCCRIRPTPLRTA